MSEWIRRSGWGAVLVQHGGPALLMLALALLLKHFYSAAGADELYWVLAPSCGLVSALGGIALTYEPGAGFITHQYHMVVGPACAGVNFLVIAWLALYFSLQGNFAGVRRKLGWMVQSAPLAYGATVLSNGLRIWMAAHLYSLGIYHGSLTPERLHRWAGAVIYCASLFALCAGVARLWGFAQRDGRVAQQARWAPLACYVGVAIGIPLAGRAYRHDPALFAEHSLVVIVTAAGLWAFATLARFAHDRLCSRVAKG